LERRGGEKGGGEGEGSFSKASFPTKKGTTHASHSFFFAAKRKGKRGVGPSEKMRARKKASRDADILYPSMDGKKKKGGGGGKRGLWGSGTYPRRGTYCVYPIAKGGEGGKKEEEGTPGKKHSVNATYWGREKKKKRGGRKKGKMPFTRPTISLAKKGKKKKGEGKKAKSANVKWMRERKKKKEWSASFSLSGGGERGGGKPTTHF